MSEDWATLIERLRDAMIMGDSEKLYAAAHDIDELIGDAEAFDLALSERLNQMWAGLPHSAMEQAIDYLLVFQDNVDLLNREQLAEFANAIETRYGDLTEPASLVLGLELMISASPPGEDLVRLERLAGCLDAGPLSVLPYGIRLAGQREQAPHAPVAPSTVCASATSSRTQALALLNRLSGHGDLRVAAEAEREAVRLGAARA